MFYLHIKMIENYFIIELKKEIIIVKDRYTYENRFSNNKNS
jgi:hypothetical protein